MECGIDVHLLEGAVECGIDVYLLEGAVECGIGVHLLEGQWSVALMSVIGHSGVWH